MDKKEFELEKELIELKHKFKMEEIGLEKLSRMEADNAKHENEKSLWRLKRADRRRGY